MALGLGPFGFEPARTQGGRPNSGGFNRYPIKNAFAGNIGNGDPVKLLNQVGGGLAVCSATTDKCLGVFIGCTFQDPTLNGQPRFLSYFPANTSASNITPMYAYVVDDPNATFFIQADASISVGDIGMNFDVSIGTSLVSGRSTTVLKAGSRLTASGLVQVVDIKQDPNNAFADAYPVVEVRIVQNRNAYTSAF